MSLLQDNYQSVATVGLHTQAPPPPCHCSPWSLAKLLGLWYCSLKNVTLFTTSHHITSHYNDKVTSQITLLLQITCPIWRLSSFLHSPSCFFCLCCPCLCLCPLTSSWTSSSWTSPSFSPAPPLPPLWPSSPTSSALAPCLFFIN